MKKLLKETHPNREWNFDLTENAQIDVKEIWQYISERSLVSADRLIVELFGKFQLLAQNPRLGKTQDRYFFNLRSFPFKKYLIFYVQTDKGIEIFRVVHSSRNVEGLFEEFFDSLK